MRRLIELNNWRDAAELVRRLNDASLNAVHTEVPPIEGDTPVSRSMVWIAEDDDMTVAKAVIDAFRADAQVSRGETCVACGYDLRGHAGEGQCPECGWRFDRGGPPLHAQAAEHDVECSSCGEEVPENFECCWSCGAQMPA